MKAYLYVPAEGRIVLRDLARLPDAGAIVACDGRRYRVRAVQAGQGRAVLSLEASALRLPAST